MIETDAEFSRVLDLIGYVIGAHEFDRTGSHETHAVQLPAVQYHLRKAQIIAGGGIQAAAARRHSRRLADSRIPGHGSRSCGVALINGRDAVELFGGDVETRVLHPEGQEDPLTQKIREGFARQFLHQIALNIDRYAIDPPFSRLIEQGQFGDALDKFLQGRRAEKLCLLIHFVDRSRSKHAVGEPRAMRHQFTHRRCVSGFVERGLAVLIDA